MKIYNFRIGYNNIQKCPIIDDFLNISEIMSHIEEAIKISEMRYNDAIRDDNKEISMYNMGVQNALKSLLDRIEELDDN